MPRGSKTVVRKWVFKRKYNIDSSIQTFKVRIVAKGFTWKKGIKCFESHALIARIISIRVLLFLASIYDLYEDQMDVKIAFLNENLTEKIYMKRTEGFSLPSNEYKVCKLIKSLYDLKQTSK